MKKNNYRILAAAAMLTILGGGSNASCYNVYP